MPSWFNHLISFGRKTSDKPQQTEKCGVRAMNTESACIWLSGAKNWSPNIKMWFDPKKEDKKNSYALDPTISDAMDRAERGERLEPD